MDSIELKEALDSLCLKKIELARLLGVTQRAVAMWCNQERKIPGAVSAYLRLLLISSHAVQCVELDRIRRPLSRSKVQEEK